MKHPIVRIIDVRNGFNIVLYNFLFSNRQSP